jgi:capsular exopolysaccharide synthesis family protein
MTTISRGPDAGAALGPYVRAIRSNALLFVAMTLVTLGGAAMLLATRSATYEATAELLVTPLQQDDRTFLGITLLRDSGDPTRSVQTAAALVSSPSVARRTAKALGGSLTQKSVEEVVEVKPLGESNILAVSAKAGSARDAARLANRYAANALQLRSEVLRAQVIDAIAELRAAERRAGGVLPEVDRARLSELRNVRDRGDPTLALAQSAQPPSSPTDAPVWLVLALALVAGLTLGAIVAVLVERADGSVRDADELVSLAGIPVLARVPTVRRRERRGPALDVPPAMRESFRTLQLQIEQRRSTNGVPGGRTIVVTSASRGDGKTTTAICLALALVDAGHRVVLIDYDLRRPEIGSRLGLHSAKGLVTLLSSSATLTEVLQPVDQLPPLQVLTGAGGVGDVANMQHLTRRVDELLAEARLLADYIVVDTAPLGLVGDALALTPFADELLLVGRTHNSDRRAVEHAIELLDRANTSPTGWVVIGDDSIKRTVSYNYAGGGSGAQGPRRGSRSPAGQ